MRDTPSPPAHSPPAGPPPWLAQGCLALSMALVGSYVALSKPLLAVMPVFLLAWLRFGIGALAMAHWLRRPRDEAPLTRRTHQLLFLESLFGNFLFSICMLYGVSLTTASAAGVVLSTIPAVVALLSALLLRERLTLRTGLAIALAAAGIGLFSLGKSGQAPAAPMLWGNLLVFGAVVCEALYVVIGKHLSQGLGARRISALINLWGLVLMTPLGLWAGWHFNFSAMNAPLWALLLFYSLAASVWTVWLWMTGLRGVDASRAGVFTVMLPVTATAFGVWFMGETLSGWQALALALALAGVVLATGSGKAGRKTSGAPEPGGLGEAHPERPGRA